MSSLSRPRVASTASTMSTSPSSAPATNAIVPDHLRAWPQRITSPLHSNTRISSTTARARVVVMACGRGRLTVLHCKPIRRQRGSTVRPTCWLTSATAQRTHKPDEIRASTRTSTAEHSVAIGRARRPSLGRGVSSIAGSVARDMRRSALSSQGFCHVILRRAFCSLQYLRGGAIGRSVSTQRRRIGVFTASLRSRREAFRPIANNDADVLDATRFLISVGTSWSVCHCLSFRLSHDEFSASDQTSYTAELPVPQPSGRTIVAWPLQLLLRHRIPMQRSSPWTPS